MTEHGISQVWPSELVSRLKDHFCQKSQEAALEPTIYRFILRYSFNDQIVVVALTLISFPILYLALELPKSIVNHAISGKDFPQRLLGVELDQIPYLAVLCLAFLALVLFNGLLKYRINVMKGRLGERMLRRLRYELYLRTLRFPLSHFSRIAAGEIIAMITSELEPVAGFIGDSFALPIYQGGTLLTIAVFMFVQDPLLGLAAVLLYPVQGYVIPKLQRKVRQLGRRRVRRIRRLADRIGDSIADRVDIRTNDYAHYQLADISNQLGEIYDIRYEIYRRKFFIKFINNFLNQLTPFFFYLIGGYFVSAAFPLARSSRFSLPTRICRRPGKSCSTSIRTSRIVGIKYEQVVEQFEVPDMLDPHLLLYCPKKVAPLIGDVVVKGASPRLMLEIFGEPNEHPELTNEFSLVRADDVPTFRAILARASSADSSALTPVDRDRLLSLALMLVPARHRLDLLDEAVRQRIVQARKRITAELPAELHGAVAFFDPAQYNPAGSIEENIVFGKLAQGEADFRDKVHSLIGDVLDELDLRELVIDIGLDFSVGTGGSRLSPAQRQKASLARALLKRPDLLVLNEATAALDGSSHKRVLNGLKQEFAARTGGVFWSAHQLELARHFDKVLVIEGGRLVAQGTADDLTKPGGPLAGLLLTQ